MFGPPLVKVTGRLVIYLSLFQGRVIRKGGPSSVLSPGERSRERSSEHLSHISEQVLRSYAAQTGYGIRTGPVPGIRGFRWLGTAAAHVDVADPAQSADAPEELRPAAVGRKQAANKSVAYMRVGYIPVAYNQVGHTRAVGSWTVGNRAAASGVAAVGPASGS